MTSLDLSHGHPAAASWRDWLASAAARLSAWQDERATRRALSRLSARELQDIGLTPGDIDLVAARGRR